MKKPNIPKQTLDYYFNQGLILIPINMEHGKRPLHKNWQSRDYKRKEIERYIKQGCNIGWKINSKHCVVDVDPKNGGVESFEKLIDFIGDSDAFERCVKIRTGGHKRGKHYYFKLPLEQQKIKETRKEFPGVEFKTKGRQVIIPGSVHPTTNKFYIFDDDRPNQITEYLPEKLIELLTYKPKEKTKHQQITNEELKEILDQIPVEHYDSNDSWFSIMAAAHNATNGQGVFEFIDWSISDPKYSNDSQLIQLRWESLRDDAPDQVSLGTLLQELFKHGGEVPKTLETKSDFDDSINIDEIKNTIDVKSLIEEIDLLPPNVNEKELEKYYKALYTINNDIVSEKIFRAIKTSLGISIQSVRSAYKQYKKKQLIKEEVFDSEENIDYADLIAKKVLNVIYNKGAYLIHANNQQYYAYNGRYWESVKQNIIDQNIYRIAKKLLKKTGYDFKVSQQLASAERVLRAKAATKVDLLRFEEVPPSVVNTLNYELWLNDKTGKIKLKKHSHKSYLTHCLDIEFDRFAKCPLFDMVLRKIFCKAEDIEKTISYFWEMFGYIIQSKKNLACWFFWHGHGQNGKSFLKNIICMVVGHKMVLPRNISEFDNTSGNAHALASLPGKLLILDDDLQKNINLPDGTLKKLSEAKFLEANPKGKDAFNFVSTATPLLLSNHWPVINDISRGFLRRVHLIPFEYELTDEEVDLNLIDKIDQKELQGILNKALQGLQRLRKRGHFDPPAESTRKIRYWLGLTNPVMRFVEAHCYKKPEHKSKFSDFYDSYRSWVLSDRGYKRQVSAGQFEEFLLQMGYQVTGGYVKGLKVKPSVND